MADASEAETEAPEGGSKKSLLIMIVVVLLAVGASVAGTLFFISGNTPEAAPVEVEPAGPAPAIYHQMRPAFIVNYVTTNKPRYLQAEIAVMSRAPATIEAVVDHMPLVRSTVLEVLNSAEFESLRTHQGKESLLEDLGLALNERLAEEFGQGRIESVLFSNFVLQ
ncbi:MAG: flagellar basal body-associated FliL family protein [Pseudomonadota bacterium]